jgi:hypothetical protein
LCRKKQLLVFYSMYFLFFLEPSSTLSKLYRPNQWKWKYIHWYCVLCSNLFVCRIWFISYLFPHHVNSIRIDHIWMDYFATYEKIENRRTETNICKSDLWINSLKKSWIASFSIGTFIGVDPLERNWIRGSIKEFSSIQ